MMTPDNVNAIGMVLMAVLTLVLVLLFGKKPLKGSDATVRITLGIILGLANLFVLGIKLTKPCIEAPERGYQFVLPSLCIICLIIFLEKKIVILVGCILLFYAGGRLGADFNQIVHFKDGYTAMDINTHRPMAKGCSEGKSADGIVALKRWHTWFTGIYNVKQ